MTLTSTKHIGIIGAGIGGLATSALLAKQGFRVTILEKNSQAGGRMGTFSAQGFTFDTGPSWYLMPEVFTKFYRMLGEDEVKELDLIKLEPSYRVFYENDSSYFDVVSNRALMREKFEKIETGSGKRLEEYLNLSHSDYQIAMENFIYKNFDSPTALLSLSRLPRLELLKSMHKYVAKYFTNSYLQKLLEFQLVFLGASPYNAPAIYNIMNHIDIDQGVYYPMGGMYKLVSSLKQIAEKYGAQFVFNSPVIKISKKNNGKVEAKTQHETWEFDWLVANADIHHVETELLEEQDRSYTQKYWKKIILAPSAHVMFLGVKRQYNNLLHHNLLFSEDWKKNFSAIFDAPAWPENPSIYVSATSKTDPNTAPMGYENLFVLTPIASSLETTEEQKRSYGDKVIKFLEQQLGLTNLSQEIIFRKDYANADYARDFNALGGSALGISHVLKQSLFLRPKHQSKKIPNLIYVGAGTTPGIGVPMQLISAEIVCQIIQPAPHQ